MPNTPTGRSTTTPSARAAADVRWAAFVADLPALIDPSVPNAPSREDAPLLRGGQRPHVIIAARRMHATGSHVPRGYRMRRGKPGTALTVREEPSAVPAELRRPESPVIHATPISTLMLPRIGHDVRMALAPADRMFLGAMSLMGGAVMAAIVAVLALRGRGDAASAAAPTAPSAQVATAIVTPVPHSESVPNGPAVPASTAAVDTAVGTPAVHEKMGVAPTIPSRESASATSRSARGGARPPRRTKAVAVIPGRSGQAEATPAKSVATPPRATPQSPAAVVTRSAAAPSTSSATSSAALPAPAPSSQNINVAEELRAIHAEIDARRKHVDSLAHALDSLNKAKP